MNIRVTEVLKDKTEAHHHPDGHHCERAVQTGKVKRPQESVERERENERSDCCSQR